MEITKDTRVDDITLYDYHDLAERCITRFCVKDTANSLLADSDCVGMVAHRLIKAAYKWKPGKGRTLRSWLSEHSKFAIMTWLRDKRAANKNFYLRGETLNWESVTCLEQQLLDHKDCILNQVIHKETITNLLCLAKKILTDREYQCLELIYVEGKNFFTAGKILGISGQSVKNNVEKCVRKLRHEYEPV